MKKMLVLLLCVVVFATFAVAVEARSSQNKALAKAQLASSYNFARDKSIAKIDAGKLYREKLNLKRLENIEKSNKQYAQKREAKIVQNKGMRMQKIVLDKTAKVIGLATKK